MKYTTPVAELLALEAVSVIMSSVEEVTTSSCTQNEGTPEEEI